LIVHLDTSVLIDALAPPWRSLDAFERAVTERHELNISAPVLFEWLRGPRSPEDLADQRAWFDESTIAVFDAATAATAADIYRRLERPRHREVDVAIAACAIEHGAALWTLNIDDFADIPGLRLYHP
jgi:predicted nucleic acid-binding protein